jgi:hypothetical protein
MDRRLFLKSLAALGASIPVAALGARATGRTVDRAIAALDGTPWWVPVLRAWKDGASPPALDALCDALEVDDPFVCSRGDVAVARLLLGGIQASLPAWTGVSEDELVSARPEFPRRLDGTPVFEPALVGMINWADSGPGFSWPEAYHVTDVPELGIRVVTGSRDSEDMAGCTDHALGWAPIDTPARDAAQKIVRAEWTRQADDGAQQRWASVLATGVLHESDLEAMRRAVWGKGRGRRRPA